MLQGTEDPAPWLMPLLHWLNCLTPKDTLIGMLILTVLNVLITAFINSRFVSSNARKQAIVQEEYSTKLTNYKADLDRQLLQYKRDIDRELAEFVEPLRASLSRANIAYQLTQAEYIKRQFTYAEDLFVVVFQFHRVIVNGLKYSNSKLTPAENETLETNVTSARKALLEKYNAASLFLPEEIINSVDRYNQAAADFIINHEVMIDNRSYKNGFLGGLTREERTEFWEISKKSDREFEASRQALIDQFMALREQIKTMSRSRDPEHQNQGSQTTLPAAGSE